LKKLGTIVPVVLLLLATSLRAHAQITGCDDSPENPTLVLGLIVSAAAIGFAWTRHSLRGRTSAKRKQPELFVAQHLARARVDDRRIAR